jgi:hypothetical protein
LLTDTTGPQPSHLTWLIISKDECWGKQKELAIDSDEV